MKYKLLLITLLVCGMGWGQTYVQVTTIGELVNGNYLIVGDGSSADGLMKNSITTGTNPYINYNSITNPGSNISTGYSSSNVFQLVVSSGVVTIFNSTVGYVSWGRSGVTGNAASFNNGVVENTERWTATVASGLWTLTNVYDNTRILQWNNSSPRFAAYTSAQIKLKLYKVNNLAPVASSLNVTGTTTLGQTLTGSYTYTDADSDAEGVSTFKWYRADDASGTNSVAISGATASTYTLQSADVNKYLRFGVIPVASTGVSLGVEALSSWQGPIANLVTSSVWTGTSWSNGTGPTTSLDAVIASNLTTTSDLACKDLTINSGTTLTIGAGKKLTVAGNLINNGSIVFKSDATGTGVFGQFTGTITGSGSVTAERYIPSRRAWRLLTAPLKGVTNTTIPANWQGVNDEGLLLFSPSTYQSQTMTGYTTGGGSPNIWKYDSANTQWQSIPNLATENLFTSTGNNGFLVFATGPSNSTNIATGEMVTTLRPQGQLITGAVSHSLTADKYHLIGNPYASAIDTEAMVQANSGTKVFMVDPTMGTVGGYVTYDGSNWAPTAPNTSDKYIQSGQGFFVRSASNPTFTISESHKAIGNSNTWFERANSSSSTNSSVEADKIRVLLYKQLNSQWQLADGILTVNSVDGNDGVDGVDTGKMTNFNENIAFRNGTSNLAIEYRGLPTTGTVQQMRLTGTTVQPYQLRVKTENYSNSGLQPYLEDTQAGTFTLIPTDGSEVVVNFTGMAATAAAPDARFRIVYPSALGVDAPDALAVGVYPNPTEEGVFTILLPLAGETARYTLTNLVGQEVQQGTLDGVQSRVSVSSLQGGVYLLEVNQSGKRFTTKLIIK